MDSHDGEGYITEAIENGVNTLRDEIMRLQRDVEYWRRAHEDHCRWDQPCSFVVRKEVFNG